MERGRIKWRAELPESHDAFVEIRLTESGEVEAQTCQGWRARINLETGSTTKEERVK
jgi:hypothetical protein